MPDYGSMDINTISSMNNAQAYGIGAGVGAVQTVISLAVGVLMIVSMWKIFEKAGEAGWKSLIPIYNFYILLKIVGKPWYWILLMLIPIVNIVLIIMTYHALSKAFGKGGGFTAGLIFLSGIFLPILAFSDAKYVGVKKED